MEEKNKNLTDEQLSQQLRKSKGGKWGGTFLSLLGGVIVFAGIVQGCNLVLIIAGVVILALGQAVLYMVMTIVIYPGLAMVMQYVLGLHRAAPGEVDTWGRRL